MDFKESGFMYALAFFVIGFVVVESVFFIVKAWKRATELGIKKETLKQTVTTSILFTLAPAIAILATVIALAPALGIVLPWIRLSVVGNLAYETVAAQTALEALGSSISAEVTDKMQFSTVVWIMTLGISFGIFLLPFVGRKLHMKLGKAVSKNAVTEKLGDIISAAAFIGIIAAFIAREVNGKSADGADDAGFMSVCTLVASIVIYLIFEFICKKFRWEKAQPFIMPLAMFAAMGVAVLLTNVLPAELVSLTWWN